MEIPANREGTTLGCRRCSSLWEGHFLAVLVCDEPKMNDWELIPAAKPLYVHKNLCYLTGLYESRSWIPMNTFSPGPNNVCVEAHETEYCEQLDKLGIEVVPIPYEAVIPFGGALHCTTLDIYREGTCEDYFPKQIPGY